MDFFKAIICHKENQLFDFFDNIHNSDLSDKIINLSDK